jgi:hypothetical protein
LDIVEEAIVNKSQASRRGVNYTAVVQEKIAEFIDVETLMRTTNNGLFNPKTVEVRS